MPKKRARKTVAKEKKSRSSTAVESEAVLLESPVESPESPVESGEVEVWDDDTELDMDISEERDSILIVIEDLEGQVDTAYELKEAVEADLVDAQKKLSETLAALAELEGRVASLETEAGASKQLREDISYAEGERNKFENLFAEGQKQLEVVIQERDSLVERLPSAEARAEELERENIFLDAEVTTLKEAVAHMDNLNSELASVTRDREGLQRQSEDLESRLEVSEVSRSSLNTELAEAQEAAGRLSEEKGGLQRELADAKAQVAEVHSQFEEEQRANKGLLENKMRLEGALAVAKSKVEVAKKALCEIRTKIARSTSRVRQRYFQPKKKE